MTKFVDDEELIGRTIKTVVIYDYSITLGFTDGSYTTITFGGYPGEGEMYFSDCEPDAQERKALASGGFFSKYQPMAEGE